jgi:probable HAF family extracellular repeat protein
MKSRILRLATGLALLAAISTSFPLGAQAPADPSHYVVIDLGTLGGTDAGGSSINNRGWVTGMSIMAGNQTTHAALWIKGAKIDLGTLPGGANSAIAWPIKNEHGVLVGFSETADVNPLGERFSCPSFFLGVPRTGHSCQGFKWENNAMTPLPTLGGFNSYATAINNRGQAVGWAENTVHDPTCVAPRQVLQFHAVIWGPKDGQIQDLPPLPLPNHTSSAATAINDQGTVVGISGICDRAVGRFSAARAVVWQDGIPTDIGNLGGVAWNTPAAINHNGEIAGFSDLPGDESGAPNFHAFLKLPGVPIQDLGTLGTDTISGAFGINDSRQVVGQSIDGATGFSRAFIWENGVMTDLNSLVPPGSPFLVYANDINERGEITGQACVVVDGQCTTTSAFLAIPVADDGQTGNAQRVPLPASLRQKLEQRFGEGMFAGISPE